MVFSGSIKPDLSKLKNGLYMLRVLDSEGTVLYNERMIKGS